MKRLLFLVLFFPLFVFATCECNGVWQPDGNNNITVGTDHYYISYVENQEKSWESCSGSTMYKVDDTWNIINDYDGSDFVEWEYTQTTVTSNCVEECTAPQIEENGICVDPSECPEPPTCTDDEVLEDCQCVPAPDPECPEPPTCTDDEVLEDCQCVPALDPECPEPPTCTDDEVLEDCQCVPAPDGEDPDSDGDGDSSCPEPASTKDGYPYVGTSSTLGACTEDIANIGGGNGSMDVVQEGEGEECIYCYYEKVDDDEDDKNPPDCKSNYKHKNPPDDMTCVLDCPENQFETSDGCMCKEGYHAVIFTDPLECDPNDLEEDPTTKCDEPKNSLYGYPFQNSYSSTVLCQDAIDSLGAGLGAKEQQTDVEDCPTHCYYVPTAECPKNSHPKNETDCECNDGYEPDGLLCSPIKNDENDSNSTTGEDDEDDSNTTKPDEDDEDDSNTTKPDEDGEDDSNTTKPEGEDGCEFKGEVKSGSVCVCDLSKGYIRDITTGTCIGGNDEDDNETKPEEEEDEYKFNEDEADKYKNEGAGVISDFLNEQMGELTTLYAISIPVPAGCTCKDLTFSVMGFSQTIKYCQPLKDIFAVARPVLWLVFLISVVFGMLRGSPT